MIPLDVGDIIPDFAETITVTSYGVGSLQASGIWQAGTPSNASVVAAVQPLTGRELQMLEGGLIQKGSVKIYTQTELTPYVANGPKADTFSWNGRTYEIHNAEDWVTIGTYYKYYGALQE